MSNHPRLSAPIKIRLVGDSPTPLHLTAFNSVLSEPRCCRGSWVCKQCKELAVRGVIHFDAGGDRWIILLVFMTGEVSMSVGCQACLFCVGDDLAGLLRNSV